MERLRRRRDFLAAAAGASVSTAGFIVQERRRDDEEPARIGFTVSRRVGSAVERNRVRRRLKEIVRLSAATGFAAGSDYVVVGRRAAQQMTFARLAEDFIGALRRLDKRRREALRAPRAGSGPRPNDASDDQSGS